MRHHELKHGLLLANALYTSAGAFGLGIFTRDFEVPKTGYLIRIENIKTYDSISKVNPHELTPILDECIKERSDNYVYSSIKKKNGSVDFDLCVILNDLDGAKTLASIYKIDTIYDIENKKDIKKIIIGA